MANIIFQSIFPKKEVKKTVLTHCLQRAGESIGTYKPMEEQYCKLEQFERIVHVGTDYNGDDLFLCYMGDEIDYPYFYKGVKGDEFYSAI